MHLFEISLNFWIFNVIYSKKINSHVSGELFNLSKEQTFSKDYGGCSGPAAERSSLLYHSIS